VPVLSVEYPNKLDLGSVALSQWAKHILGFVTLYHRLCVSELIRREGFSQS